MFGIWTGNSTFSVSILSCPAFFFLIFFTVVPTSSSVLSTEKSQVKVPLQVAAGLVGNTTQHSVHSAALPDGSHCTQSPHGIQPDWETSPQLQP